MEEIERPGDVTLSFDWFLRVLVGMANSSRLQVNVTLNVGGLLLSGTLISERQYFEGVAEGIRSATAPT